MSPSPPPNNSTSSSTAKLPRPRFRFASPHHNNNKHPSPASDALLNNHNDIIFGLQNGAIMARQQNDASPMIYHALLSNLQSKTIETASRDASYQRLLQNLSTSVAHNSQCQLIVCGPTKVGKCHMLRNILKKIEITSAAQMRAASKNAQQKKKKVKVLWIDSVESPAQLMNLLKGSILSWIQQEIYIAKKQGTETKKNALLDKQLALAEDERDEAMHKSLSSNTFDIISDEQLGEMESLLLSLSEDYHVYPVLVFRHFDRVCKLANKLMYHLLDMTHTTKMGMALVGVSQSTNLHTILDKGTGSIGKLGGLVGSYTRIKSRLYNGKFILVRSFRNEQEIIEAIHSLFDLSTMLPAYNMDESLLNQFEEALSTSLEHPSIFTPLLLYPDCSSLVHVCRSVVHRIRKRGTLEISLLDWSESINDWISSSDRLNHLESFNNLELCMLLAARDVEEQIMTPSQEMNRTDQKQEFKKEWFSFSDVYARFMAKIGGTTNLDIKAEFASREHMIPDVTTERANCSAAYKSLFSKGFLKRFDTRTVLEDSKARFNQLHPQEIRSYIVNNSDLYHTSIIQWAEEDI